jgi:hypothetical protein
MARRIDGSRVMPVSTPRRNAFPGHRIPLAEMNVLRIRPERHDDRKRSGLRRPKHVGEDGRIVAQRNRHVLLDQQ